ncbi:MAG: hypothetical protein QW534_00015 [Candidatus Methanomethylicia archaeon]
MVFKTLKDKGIDTIVEKNVKACRAYNGLKRESKKVALVIHLTC